MKKYLQNRKLVTIKCDYCGSEFQKPETEYKRNVNLNRHNFCSRQCCGKYIRTLDREPSEAQIKIRNSIKNHSNNRHDEYYEFRYLFRCSKSRMKECDLDLPYLKQLWEKQKGICPYTKLKLILPTWNNTVDIRYRASIDRIDSSKGYIKGNVQFVATPINYLKASMSDEMTKSYIKEIVASVFTEDQTISSPTNVGQDALAGN